MARGRGGAGGAGGGALATGAATGAATGGAGAAGGGAGAAGFGAAAADAIRGAMSSPGSAITPMSAPTGALPPAGTRILRRTPAPSASISMLALSVSISAITSPTLMASPSFLLHLTIVPSSMVGESLASTTLVMAMDPYR